MGKLFVLLIVLALVAAVFIVLALVVSDAIESRPRRKEIERREKDWTPDDLWLYSNGASVEEIELAKAQRKLLL